MPARDDFTSTVDGAAAHARLFAEEPYDDGPSLTDVYEPPRPPVKLCRARREKDGVVTFCGRREHGPDVLHEPSPWLTMTVEEEAYWAANVPF